VQIPQENHVKYEYLGLHLDRRLTWTHTFLQNVNSLVSPSPRCTGYSDASPTSLPTTNSSSTNLSGHTAFSSGVRPQIQTFRAFSIQSLAANSECPLVCAKFRHPQGPSNTNSKRRNQPIQLTLWCSHKCTPQWTHRHTHRAANPQAPASILAPRPAYQILAICNTCITCLQVSFPPCLTRFPNPLLTEECYWALFYKTSLTLPTICQMYYYKLQINWVFLQKKVTPVCCLAMTVFAEPFPSNGCLLWLHNSFLEQICHNIPYIYIIQYSI
jgi:hypothetical protein